MQTSHFFYHMLLILALTTLVYCGNGNNENEHSNGTTGATNSDSAMSAHNRDPSTAYPAPPVTGSNQDSSYVKDSANKQ
jgi:hypothetical protein